MCRERKTPGKNGGCRAAGRVETEGLAGARSIGTRETENGDSVELLEKVLSVDNMFDACERVTRNPLNRRVPNGTHGGVRGRPLK